MKTIWDKIRHNPSERPKYTRFELGVLVRKKREKLSLSQRELAENYGFTEKMIDCVEKGSCAFNVRIYSFICTFLEMTQKEVLEKEIDDMKLIKQSLNNTNNEIRKTVKLANEIFNEIVMQEKIATK